MADVFENLVHWPTFADGAKPPKTAWYIEDDRDSRLQIEMGGAAPDAYAYASSYDLYLGFAVPNFPAANEYTLLIDAEIENGVTVTVFAGEYGYETLDQTLGQIIGDGTRQLHAITATLATVTGVMYLKPPAVGGLVNSKVYGVRVSPGVITDSLGVFSGASIDPAGEVIYSWSDAPYASTSLATVEAPAPPAGAGLADRVMLLLNLDSTDAEEVEKAETTVDAIKMMVKGYTRGRGFTKTEDPPGEIIAEDIEAVILTAAVRYLANPTGLAYRAGSESVTDAFKGWTLAETFVLNNYRSRWA